MSEIYQKNLDSFLSRYPQYKSQIDRIDLELLRSKYQTNESPSGLDVFEMGFQVDSTDLKSFPLKFESEKAHRLLILEGFGIGSFFQKVQGEMPAEVEEMIVVEPSLERFLFALSFTDFGDLFLSKKLHWLIGLKPEEFFAHSYQMLMSRPRCFYMQSWSAVPHPFLRLRDAEYFDRILDEWKAAQLQLLRSAGFLEDSLMGFRNVFENRDLIERNPGIQHLENAFQGKPAIVVATGPSLDESIPLLKELQDKAVILSADASAKILLENGIEPHFILSLERVMDTLPFYDSIRSHKGKLKTNFLAFPLVPRQVIESFPGQILFCYRNQNYFRFLNDQVPRGILSSSSSVSHFCLRLAEYMGAEVTALVGQDLAYDPKTLRSHASGVAYEDWQKEKSEAEVLKSLKETDQGKIVMIPGNFEDLVPSNPTYFAMLKEYSWEALTTKTRIVNCTEGGAKIPNVEWMSLASLSRSWEKFDVFGAMTGPGEHVLEGSFKWAEIGRRISAYHDRLLQLEKQCQAALQDQNLSSNGGQELVRLLRSTCDVFVKDLFFCSFILEMSGRKILEIENRWYQFLDQPGQEKEKLKVLLSWFQELRGASQQVAQILSDKESIVAAS